MNKPEHPSTTRQQMIKPNALPDGIVTQILSETEPPARHAS
jgi:hypothetical protein